MLALTPAYGNFKVCETGNEIYMLIGFCIWFQASVMKLMRTALFWVVTLYNNRDECSSLDFMLLVSNLHQLV
jgi:hypothetical protein